MNKNERMNALVNNGIDTSKYFNINITKDLPKGSVVTIKIGDDGLPTISMNEFNEIMEKIDEGGYVPNYDLFRRWVMAQMFRMLGHKDGFSEALKEKPYEYQWKVLENEFHALAKIQKEDPKRFTERKVFFTKNVAVAMMNDYLDKVAEHVKYRWRMEHGKIAATNICNNFVMIDPDNYSAMYDAIKKFNNAIKMYNCQLKKDTPKCKEWIEAFKGNGSYYTLQNLYRFHLGNRFLIPKGMGYVMTTREAAEIELKYKVKECNGQWYKLFGYMKDVIEANKFDFADAMNRVYCEKAHKDVFGF